ncbi:glucosamine-6-phosphate isomerase [[Candida] jaroonii]|uniref:Glucosamine-6-phosphate isomerase n=1 Tax=[Candida] jaroonii TaxID=467808 RepID=A0ACA9Y867_9ASCO|nr:glucosamine-6-phosphate isomerase [[Candida] jaroonii]
MRQATFSNKQDASNYVAQYIVDKINSFRPTPLKPFILGLPTGSSPEGIYKKLIEYYNQGKISFQNVVTFNMDEYVGLSPVNDQSYHYFMYNKFFNHIDIPKENINILNGLSNNIEQECKNYEEKIKKYGKIHLFLGGLGIEGHLAFNETGSSRDSITRKIELVPSTIEANSRFFDNDLNKVPKFALSVGISTILDNSEEIIVIILGKNKKFALDQTINGKMGSKYPSSWLQDHPNVLLVSDFEAYPKL